MVVGRNYISALSYVVLAVVIVMLVLFVVLSVTRKDTKKQVKKEKVEDKEIEDLVKETEEPEVLGVENLGDSSVVFRIVGKCKPTKHFLVQRQMRKELKNAMDKNGIKIPYPQIEVHNEK